MKDRYFIVFLGIKNSKDKSIVVSRFDYNRLKFRNIEEC